MVIYTSFTPDYDEPRTDVVFIPPAADIENPAKATREPKILFHKYFPDEEFTMWVDGNIYPRALPRKYIELLGDNDICINQHNLRICAYAEAGAVLSLKLDKPEIVLPQMNRYLAEGYPENNGLARCGVIIRRNTKLVRDFCELWWSEVEKGSHRDQLSFNYCLYKFPGIKIRYLQRVLRNSHLFRTRNHKNK